MVADKSSTIEEGRAMWLQHEKTMHGQLQSREMDNETSSNKRSATTAKCQTISLDYSGLVTQKPKAKPGLGSEGIREVDYY